MQLTVAGYASLENDVMLCKAQRICHASSYFIMNGIYKLSKLWIWEMLSSIISLSTYFYYMITYVEKILILFRMLIHN